MIEVPIARSDIHVHLSEQHRIVLFGHNAPLTVWRRLTIPGQFASHQTVRVVGPAGSIDNVVVVGPERNKTQVEISITDGLKLGITPPLRRSGELEGTPGCRLEGPAGAINLGEGVMASRRHIHMHSDDARRWRLRDGQTVKVRIPGPRGLTFDQVELKVGENQALEMHVDFDEGHAAGIEDFQIVEMIP